MIKGVTGIVRLPTLCVQLPPCYDSFGKLIDIFAIAAAHLTCRSMAGQGRSPSVRSGTGLSMSMAAASGMLAAAPPPHGSQRTTPPRTPSPSPAPSPSGPTGAATRSAASITAHTSGSSSPEAASASRSQRHRAHRRLPAAATSFRPSRWPFVAVAAALLTEPAKAATKCN